MLRYIRIIGAILSVIAGLYVGLHEPPAGLTVPAMRGLGVIIWAVGCWVVDIVPEYIIGMLMCILWVITKSVKFPQAFATFASGTWWMIISAFALGVAAAKCGLLRRISLFVLKLFSTSFKGQVLGFLAAGTIISPLIPSMNAKGALAAPIVHAVSKALGYKDNSTGAAGLFGAMFIAFCLTGLVFMSASVSNYVLLAMIPQQSQADITWTTWFLYAIPWGVVVLSGIGLFIIMKYKPGGAKPMSSNFAAEELAKLGPMVRDEIITTIVLLGTLVLWITESIHKISGGEVGVVAMCILLALKVIDREDFRKKIDWAALVYVGSIINMAGIIQVLKLDKWIGHVLEPSIAALLGNPYLFVICVGLLMFILRFIFVSLTAASALFILILAPLMLNYGMHPWIIVFITYTYSGVFFLPYTNSMFLCSYYAVGGEMCTHRQVIPISIAYAGLSILACLISIPYWQMVGLIK
ncbi:SLC13 family permease [Sporomusa acidovorans]|uniref:Sodium-dependent dicarboxylate transporter SdcS n=1 Tax=Sporomusa acidovorans (strain ATCC 49682 / DSM 3132 / Mol) TaxID=1123286 RepID=A0ABZ3IX49_SPOA4|nr:SLC13 family permease [Sporomusa acidovorans]OZC13050.1 inner membrane protein YbhI [Sporomusa acidovorans DSM 3132]SDF51139.1 divalent anion:Na+ symporter, DASS family [Sporomusa acidovorans]